jgi:hypothetical protein
MTELRQRSSGASRDSSNNNMPNETDSFVREAGAGLSAKSMIATSPQQHGVVLKLHVPVLYTILPEFLQRIILSWSFLSFMAPAWKQRYLILCGSFLYKFKDQATNVPKGAPFEVDNLNVDKLGNASFPELGVLPPGFTAVFSVSTLRRKHYYAVADNDEGMLWVRSLQEAKQETITRNMGHSSSMPYPKSWSYFDSLGRNLVKSKERIRDRLDESRLREMEMTDFSEAGPLPRGYHG